MGKVSSRPLQLLSLTNQEQEAKENKICDWSEKSQFQGAPS